MKLYLRVTDDEYEFPIAIADTKTELARMCGVTYETIRACLCRARKGKYNSVYKEVEVDEC